MMSLRIQKRNGEDASFNPQKIYQRIKRSAKGLNATSSPPLFFIFNDIIDIKILN